MDLQCVVRQKDAELEQRAALLLKTKGAIEQLQEELAGARQDADKWRRAAERQGGQAADVRRQVLVLEAERQLQEANDGLHSAADSAAVQSAAAGVRLREVERALAASQADAKAAREQVAALQAAVADGERARAEQTSAAQRLEQQCCQQEAKTAGLAEQLAAAQRQGQEEAAVAGHKRASLTARTLQLESQLAAEREARQQAEHAAVAAREALAAAKEVASDEHKGHALEGAVWERRLREAQQDAADRLARREAAWDEQHAALQHETATAVDEVRRQLTKRLYLAEGEWAVKLQRSSAEWAAKLDRVSGEWEQRCDAEKAAWAEERARLLEELDVQLADVEHARVAAVEEARDSYRRKQAAVEAKAVEAADRAWQQRFEAAVTKARDETRAAVDSCAAGATQRAQHLQAQLAAARDACDGKRAQLDRQWAVSMAAAEERQMKERHELERQWAEKLHAADKAAGKAQALLLRQLDALHSGVTQRVDAILHKEAKRKTKRAELLRRVSDLEASGKDERGRRREAEAALREASSAFRRELADRGQQLDLLRQELRARTSPAHKAAASAAAAARAVDGEVLALRSARRAYQRAALGQQELCASVARTINDALAEADVGASGTQASGRSAGDSGLLAGGRRRWKRDLAARLGELCG